MAGKIKPSTWVNISLAACALATGLWYTLSDPGASAEQAQVIRPVQEHSQQENDQDHHVSPQEKTRANVLLMGIDERGLGDAIVIFSYDLETFESVLISIKRDTYVDFQTWSQQGHGHSALGWASYVGMGYGEDDYHGGAKHMADTVEKLLGIHIDAYAAITFANFITLIDSIDGVTVEVAPGFAERSEDQLTPGRQHLTGEEALVFARHRQNPRIPEPGSSSPDGDRIRRHHQLLKAIFDQVETLGRDELLDIFDIIDQELHTNLDYWDFMILTGLLYDQDPDLAEAVILPGELKTLYEDHIDEEIEYYFLDLAECDQLLTELGLK